MTRALAGALLLVAATAAAQSPATGPTFDVVSVRESAPQTGNTITVRPGSPMPGGGWMAQNATLRQILERAFPDFARPGMIVGAPAWVDQRHFDLQGKTDHEPDRAQYPLMVQRVLAERFGLKTHVEARPSDVYWLVVARPDGHLGPRLRPASATCLAELEADRQRLAARTGPVSFSSNDIGPCGRHTSLGIGGGELIRMIDAQPMARLASALQTYARQLVVDHTGLEGTYEYDLEWDFASTRQVQSPSDAAPGGPTVFTAVQEQLGLKLERHRDPMDVLVIDTISLPSAN